MLISKVKGILSLSDAVLRLCIPKAECRLNLESVRSQNMRFISLNTEEKAPPINTPYWLCSTMEVFRKLLIPKYKNVIYKSVRRFDNLAMNAKFCMDLSTPSQTPGSAVSVGYPLMH